MNVRKCTVLIIKRGAEFLVGRIPYSMEFRWSGSPYDAWGTRVREQAEAVARVTGGDLWLFNPIVGQLKERTKQEISEVDGSENKAENADHDF